MFPEHTALAYREAARQGADLIECDLAITKVNVNLFVLICDKMSLFAEKSCYFATRHYFPL